MASDSEKPSRRGWKGILWIAATSMLIAFIAYTSQIFIVLPAHPRGLDSRTKRWLLAFNAVVGLIYWNYAVCIRTDPGHVPLEWEPPIREDDRLRNEDGAVRYCRSCQRNKPPRAHHCRQCRKCILRMDHHCAFMNAGALRVRTHQWQNCVGHYNYSSFIRFLLLVDVGIIMHLYTISQCAFGKTMYSIQPTKTYVCMLVLNYAASIPVLLTVGIFSIYHMYCVATNTTTIEGYEKEKLAKMRRRGHIQSAVYPYNLGILENLAITFGRTPLRWCWPLQQPEGSGLYFATKADIDPRIQYTWPPKDPFRTAPVRGFTAANGLDRYACPPLARDDGFGDAVAADDEEDGIDIDGAPTHVQGRRGSEGYEIRPFTAKERESIVRQYALSRGHDVPDRYRRYDPDHESLQSSSPEYESSDS